MTRWLRALTLTLVATLLPVSGYAQSRASLETLTTTLRDARDADLRADWYRLLEARARVAAWDGAADAPALVAYHLAYIDWRLSSLAFLVVGPAGMTPLLDRAVGQLRSAVATKPTFGEAHALLATCSGILANTDRSRLEQLMPVIKDAWTAALEHGASSPRVQLLRAMTEVFVPPQYGGNAERGLERWTQAIALFEQEEKTGTEKGAPAWGHAEAWAWLGGAHLTSGRHRDAQAALENAVRLRPDFWWAAKAALPQARRQP